MTKKRAQDRMVKIGVARDQVEASIWRDVLLQNGINVFIKNLDPLAALPQVETTTLYNLEAYVRASDEQQARSILGLGTEQNEPATS